MTTGQVVSSLSSVPESCGVLGLEADDVRLKGGQAKLARRTEEGADAHRQTRRAICVSGE